MLDVHDDVAEVQQHPAPLALALPPDRLGAEPEQALLDGVLDGFDLPVVAGRTEQEHVGQRELLRHIEGQDILGQFVPRRRSGGTGQLHGASIGCHR